MNRLCYEENLYWLVMMQTETKMIIIHEVFKLFNGMHAMLSGGI